jgi:hypothetical protein
MAAAKARSSQSHVHCMADVSAPESKEYDDEVARFFGRHLGKARTE